MMTRAVSIGAAVEWGCHCRLPALYLSLANTIATVRAIRQANLSDKVLRFTIIPSLLIVLGRS